MAGMSLEESRMKVAPPPYTRGCLWPVPVFGLAPLVFHENPNSGFSCKIGWYDSSGLSVPFGSNPLTEGGQPASVDRVRRSSQLRY